ncbi:hypothetical protein J0383_02200 [Flavobacterium endoglycinae]|uniref:Uncharacterized protein n=1 Tax=Flavobacterium endoglycinae TaxID=2816357 RepID=A0ABX7QG86_9FLAO|nr:hypothetical protein [Flavobacterium endoglycinae]QSW89638.1 hypothetical protein J0383_02200 [Flavobacterium endoglycinae]
METPYVYFERILSKLAESYLGSCTLQALAPLVIPPYNVLKTFSENISVQRENQAKILDALILLEDLGYIVLDQASDESCITAKGLIQINHRILSN